MGRAEKQQEGGRGARIPVLLSQPVEGVADADAAAATTVAGPSHQPCSSELPRPLLGKLVLSFLLECGLVASIWILGILVT